jgi:transposase
MDDSLPIRFFQEPSSGRQRQYEALRAVFLEGLSQKEAADRFGYSYDSFRQLVHEFRQSFHDGPTPPFSSRPGAAGRPRRSAHKRPPGPTPPPTPTPEA